MVNENALRLQRQVPLGSNVEIWLKNGKEVSGILDEISTTHLTLKQPSGAISARVPMDKVDGWLLLSQETNGTDQQANVGATEGYLAPSLQTTSMQFPRQILSRQ